MADKTGSYPEFAMPEGLTLPDDAKPGGEFEALGTLRIKEDGKLCLVAVDGIPIGSEKDEEQKLPEKPADADLSAIMRAGMEQAGIPA